MKQINIFRVILPVILCSVLLTACNKYLDVIPKGYKLLTTVDDYDQWLNDPGLWGSSSILGVLNVLGDNYDMPAIAVPAASEPELLYTWAQQPAQTASLWGIHYLRISSYNTVISGIDAATGGIEQRKKALKAEALLGRAYEYFYLINEYGKPFDSATAATDPGVQIIVSDNVSQQVPPRSTVKEVYDFILADLQAAIPNLPDDNSKNRFRASAAAGYSLLARMYLSIRNYNKASENAALALDKSVGQAMINYATLGASTALPALSVRQDAIFARGDQSTATPTQQFLKFFSIRDRRLNLFYAPVSDLTFSQRGLTKFTMTLAAINIGTSVQEMKLIIAEAAARNNDLTEALKQLDEVRKNRIISVFYTPYKSDDKNFVLQKVLEERQFEFPFHGMRWFDMRRLDAEERMTAVNRLDAQGNIIATLQPHSFRYTLLVPDYVLQYNPGMEQNK